MWKASVILLSHVMLIGFPAVRRLWDIKIQQKRVLRLATILAQTDKSWLGTIEDEEVAKEDGLHSRPTLSSETPLISAARNGITEIVEVILKRFPQAIEHRIDRNDRLENILHIAARYRRKEILDLLQYLHVPTLRLKRLINVDLDTILHQAAYLGEHRLRDRPGEALRMQSEIQWFKVLILPAFP